VLVIGFVASLPFLGAGIAPPTAEWGAMIYDGRGTLETAWWVVVFPALLLLITAIAVALIVDGLLGDDRPEGL
jgi:peptide/nickel transport system permease protein